MKMDNNKIPTVTKLDLALKEKQLSDLVDELRELSATSHLEIVAIQEALVSYIEASKKIIEEMSNAE